MICYANLSNSSLALAKLRKHFLKLHGDGKYKNTTLGKFNVKRARFDEKATLPVLGYVPINQPILTASYEVAYLIAKQGKPHSIGETLIKPAMLKMANIMLGKAAEVKLFQIPLSNDTISDRIGDMGKDILAQPLTTTKAADVKKLVDDFFKDNSISWDMISAVCSDGVMLGRKSGFGALVKSYAPHIIVTHCILHRHALATKTLPLAEWLSRGQVLNRVFSVRVELALFLQEHQHCHADCFKNSEFILILAYMADIFAALNHLNHQMQGGGVNIIEAEENLKAFQKKLPLWKRRTENDNFANFPLLNDCVSKIEDASGIGDISVPAELKQAIATHLDELAKSLYGYFPTRESYPAWVRQPFTFTAPGSTAPLQNNNALNVLVSTTVIAKKALEIFIPFVTTYLCEQSFSRMLDIKTKKRNRLCCENDTRVALAKEHGIQLDIIFTNNLIY
ncbi:protein FAM200C-like [Arctopsyche grandis]|uniref:protein FAM200C-like n=1 Tax=Arctopsyche grandis TaxID=121162 RepID=UPI00406D7EAD